MGTEVHDVPHGRFVAIGDGRLPYFHLRAWFGISAPEEASQAGNQPHLGLVLLQLCDGFIPLRFCNGYLHQPWLAKMVSQQIRMHKNS